MNFRVGQKVVCVDDKAHPHPLVEWSMVLPPLKQGDVYTISGFESRSGMLGVYLCEVKSNAPPFKDGGERSFLPSRFRPVAERSTDISIFTEMLKPKQRELISH